MKYPMKESLAVVVVWPATLSSYEEGSLSEIAGLPIALPVRSEPFGGAASGDWDCRGPEDDGEGDIRRV